MTADALPVAEGAVPAPPAVVEYEVDQQTLQGLEVAQDASQVGAGDATVDRAASSVAELLHVSGQQPGGDHVRTFAFDPAVVDGLLESLGDVFGAGFGISFFQGEAGGLDDLFAPVHIGDDPAGVFPGADGSPPVGSQDDEVQGSNPFHDELLFGGRPDSEGDRFRVPNPGQDELGGDVANHGGDPDDVDKKFLQVNDDGSWTTVYVRGTRSTGVAHALVQHYDSEGRLVQTEHWKLVPGHRPTSLVEDPSGETREARGDGNASEDSAGTGTPEPETGGTTEQPDIDGPVVSGFVR